MQVSVSEITRAVQIPLQVRLRQAFECVESIDFRASTYCPQNTGNKGRRASTVATEFENVAPQSGPAIFQDQEDVSELLWRNDCSAARGVVQSLLEKLVLAHSILVEPAELKSPSTHVAGAQVAPMMDPNWVTAWIKDAVQTQNTAPGPLAICHRMTGQYGCGQRPPRCRVSSSAMCATIGPSCRMRSSAKRVDGPAIEIAPRGSA